MANDAEPLFVALLINVLSSGLDQFCIFQMQVRTNKGTAGVIG